MTSRRKRRYSRKNGSIGILGVLFFLIMGLVLFGNDSEKKVGWGIIAGISLLCLIAGAGDAAPVVFLLIIILGLALLAFLSAKTGNNQAPNHDVSQNNSSSISSQIKSTNASTSEQHMYSASVKKNKKEYDEDKHVSSYRHEESKHSNKNSSAGIIKTTVKPIEEPIKTTAESIEIKDIGLTKGMAIGEMEWTHIEKGHIAENEIPKREFFESIEEAKKEYDIPDDYIRIMIESNEDGTMKECPALVWKDNFFLNVLPLIKKSKVSCWSLKRFKEVSYRIIAEVDPDSRYNDIGMAAIANEFEDKFPKYMFDGKYGTYTSVFVFPEGIEITNTSAKGMFELLNLEPVLNDVVAEQIKYIE